MLLFSLGVTCHSPSPFARLRAALALVVLITSVFVGLSAPPAAAQQTDLFHPVGPTRLMDTRLGLGGVKLAPGETRDLVVAGAGGVPSGAVAVVLNMTVTQPGAGGWLTVWPAGSSVPVASSVNYVAGQTIANSVVVGVGAGGKVSITNPVSSAHVVVDVTGWFEASSNFGAVGPTRLMDTRLGLGGVKLAPGETRDLVVAGAGGVPSGAVAVVLNMTVTQPGAGGWLTVWPAGSSVPVASSVNYVAGQTIANSVVVGVGAGGKVSITNPVSSAHVVVDVTGWFEASSNFGAVGPTRLMDTRLGLGGVKLAPGETRDLVVAGAGGVPSGAVAVVLNMTVTQPGAGGWLTVWPAGSSVPVASSVNYVAGQTIANSVVVGVGAGGKVSITNPVSSAHVVVDVTGWFASSPPPPTGAMVSAAPGEIETMAGQPNQGGNTGDGGPATSAKLIFAHELATDSGGNVYISDYFDHTVRRVDAATGIIDVYAGSGTAGFSGDGGPATSAELNNPVSLAFDPNDNLFIADHTNHRVRRVDAATGTITTVAGTGVQGSAGRGVPATSAQLDTPEAVAVYNSTLYIGTFFSDEILEVDLNTQMLDTLATIYTPGALAVGPTGTIYAASAWGHQIFSITPGGTVTLLAGTGSFGWSGDGGPATAATLSRPDGLDVDAAGNVYVSNRGQWVGGVPQPHNRVSRIDSAGIITTIAGDGSSGHSGDGGTATLASIEPDGIAVDPTGTQLYAAQPGSNTIRVIGL